MATRRPSPISVVLGRLGNTLFLVLVVFLACSALFKMETERADLAVKQNEEAKASLLEVTPEKLSTAKTWPVWGDLPVPEQNALEKDLEACRFTTYPDADALIADATRKIADGSAARLKQMHEELGRAANQYDTRLQAIALEEARAAGAKAAADTVYRQVIEELDKKLASNQISKKDYDRGLAAAAKVKQKADFELGQYTLLRAAAEAEFTKREELIVNAIEQVQDADAARVTRLRGFMTPEAADLFRRASKVELTGPEKFSRAVLDEQGSLYFAYKFVWYSLLTVAVLFTLCVALSLLGWLLDPDGESAIRSFAKELLTAKGPPTATRDVARGAIAAVAAVGLGGAALGIAGSAQPASAEAVSDNPASTTASRAMKEPKSTTQENGTDAPVPVQVTLGDVHVPPPRIISVGGRPDLRDFYAKLDGLTQDVSRLGTRLDKVEPGLSKAQAEIARVDYVQSQTKDTVNAHGTALKTLDTMVAKQASDVDAATKQASRAEVAVASIGRHVEADHAEALARSRRSPGRNVFSVLKQAFGPESYHVTAATEKEVEAAVGARGNQCVLTAVSVMKEEGKAPRSRSEFTRDLEAKLRSFGVSSKDIKAYRPIILRAARVAL